MVMLDIHRHNEIVDKDSTKSQKRKLNAQIK